MLKVPALMFVNLSLIVVMFGIVNLLVAGNVLAVRSYETLLL